MRRDRGRELIFGLVVALATAILGVLLGFIWYLVAPPLPLRKVQGGLAYIAPDPEQQVAQDGWFAILGLIFGIVVSVAVWVIARAWRGPIQLFAVTVGAVGAGFLAWVVGTQIGASGYEERLAAAPMDAIVQRPPELSATSTKTCVPYTDQCVTTRGGDLLVPALGAVISYAVLAGWSRWPSLRRREEEEYEAMAEASQLPVPPPDPAQGWHQPWPGHTPPSSSSEPGQAGPGWPEPPGSPPAGPSRGPAA
ncbi:DUF2567 domain-containing protein [Allorhizocola rhizosphaerae]|uniref:DUF2567 domain-containing protein n=1 Tax=Allorhizocola rhizosphaerae TaxID=1872709 RepID=UPI0013C2BCDF|nr:DUF2567 domain-containing protein [Allorhizocola rhizosphaerae]